MGLMDRLNFSHVRWKPVIPRLVTGCFKYLPVSKRLNPGFHKSVSIAFTHEREETILLKIMELLETTKF